MTKRIMTDFLPAGREGASTAIYGRFSKSLPLFIGLGLMLLTALIWPASAPGQAPVPPPVHSFGLEPGANEAEGDADELILIDLFDLPDEGSPPAPAPAAATAPEAARPSADSGPPAGPPVVNLPPIPAPAPSPAEPAPPAQVQAPAETVPQVQVPIGYTPLPAAPGASAPGPSTPGTSTPASSTPDPFALPPVAGPAAAPDLPADEGRTVTLGQSPKAPAPPPENADTETTPNQSQVISGVPLPKFEGDQSNWIQLEIGQGDGSGPARPAARPTSVYSLPDPAAKPLEPLPAEDAVEAATDQALDQAISQPPAAAGRPLDSPSGRDHLRNLFSDMHPSEGQGARAPVVTPPAAAGTPPPAEAAGPGQAPRKDDEDLGSSSILKAGGLLTVDEHFGAAEILPPLSGRPRWPAPEEQAAPVKPAPAPQAAPAKVAPPPSVPAPKAEAPKAETPRAAAKPAAKSAPAKAKKSASKKPAGKAQAAPSVPAGVGLMIINETGWERVGRQYRSVLAQMGYKVVSVGEGKPGRGTAGQTLINYRPGLKAKAQAVARHLPGKKVLVEAKKGQVLASEIMIYIR